MLFCFLEVRRLFVGAMGKTIIVGARGARQIPQRNQELVDVANRCMFL